MLDFNLDSAIECVKRIYENNLCVSCDKPEKRRMRFSCGHSACENCVSESLGCFICLTPPESTPSKSSYDATLTQQAKNASDLLQAFQEAFKIDVYKRKRLSEKLKLEKELFPQCIQAPATYYNKRKSFNKSFTEEENYSFQISGEHMSLATMKKNSINNVQNWLNQNEKNLKRKPLADLNVDNANVKRQASKPSKKMESSLKTKVYKNKRKHGKKSAKTRNSLAKNKDDSRTSLRIVKSKQNSNNIFAKSNDQPSSSEMEVIDITRETDESGILVDVDSIMLMEDTQLSVNHDDDLPSTVDKDQCALLAVLEADKNETSINTLSTNRVEINQTNENITTTDIFQQHYKVPYYKLGYLKETCKLCYPFISEHNIVIDHHKDQSQKINITIDDRISRTTININNNAPRLHNFDIKKSIAIQTHISSFDKISNNCEQVLDTNSTKTTNQLNDNTLVAKSKDIHSPDLFLTGNVPYAIEENVTHNFHTEKDKNTNIIIEESDSSEDLEGSRVIEVTADIHKSSDQFDCDVLTQVENVEEHGRRPRRRPRGDTPDSSNSSDKENLNPNKFKKAKNSKKACYKK